MIRREGRVPVRRHLTEVQDMPHTSDRDLSVSIAPVSPRVSTDDICLNGNGILYSPPKSAKRKRAEELLEQKYAQQQKPFRPQKVDSGDATTVSACSHTSICSSPQKSKEERWCSFDVSLASNWGQAASQLSATCSSYDLGHPSAHQLSQQHCADPEPMQFPGGFRVYVVNEACHVQGALDSLQASMADRVVGIDLEWRPDVGRSQKHRVALMQLASSTCAVLIRTCRMDTLPACLTAFLGDPATALVGFSWDAADEKKARSSFSLGRKDFGLFYDVQKVAAQLGYSRFGLGRLCEAILGLDLPKPKHVTMSDWEQKALSQQQIVYAALDALVTGQLFRGLRLLHSKSLQASVLG